MRPRRVEGSRDLVHLRPYALGEFGSVPAGDLEPDVGPEESADVDSLDLAVVLLGIDDPHAACADRDVVDVGAATGDTTVVENVAPPPGVGPWVEASSYFLFAVAPFHAVTCWGSGPRLGLAVMAARRPRSGRSSLTWARQAASAAKAASDRAMRRSERR